MAIVRWNPFREFETLQDRMNRVFNDALVTGRGEENLFEGKWLPAVDVYEDEDQIRLMVEIPGIPKEDIDIQLHDNVLTIKGERKFDKEEKRDNYHRIERGFGTFSRSFTIPNDVQRDKVAANYKDGVLTLTLPKAEETKPKQISITVD
ncbi:Hsp20/alpha crystallin family protein [bacterium]|nr:Hsp20/alpha crystallin family protein [candidate division CSSED10-310 bacterium]